MIFSIRETLKHHQTSLYPGKVSQYQKGISFMKLRKLFFNLDGEVTANYNIKFDLHTWLSIASWTEQYLKFMNFFFNRRNLNQTAPERFEPSPLQSVDSVHGRGVPSKTWNPTAQSMQSVVCTGPTLFQGFSSTVQLSK